MSKILNGINIVLKEYVESGIYIPVMVIAALPALIFSGNKDGLYTQVLIAFVLAVGLAVIQWDRGQYKPSNGWQVGMAVFLVMTWSLIGNDNKWAPLMIALNVVMFMMQFYFWGVSFREEKLNNKTLGNN